MVQQAAEVMFSTAVLIFENLGFLLPTEELDESQTSAPLTATAAVSFRGSFGGSLVLNLYGNLLPEIAANMLGAAAAPDPRQQLDALRELANVTCGNLLPALAGTAEVFMLDPPQAVAGDGLRETYAPDAAHAEAQVGFCGGRAQLLLFVNAPAAVGN